MAHQETCSICIDNIHPECLITLECGHHFHYKCVVNLITHSANKINHTIKCPYCRKEHSYCKIKPPNLSSKQIYTLVFGYCNKCKSCSDFALIGKCAKHMDQKYSEDEVRNAIEYVFFICKNYDDYHKRLVLDIALQLIRRYGIMERKTISDIFVDTLDKMRSRGSNNSDDFYRILKLNKRINC